MSAKEPPLFFFGKRRGFKNIQNYFVCLETEGYTQITLEKAA
jgi:hypothetical protein